MEVTLVIPNWVVVIATIIIALWLLNPLSTTVLYVMELRLARERRKGKYLRRESEELKHCYNQPPDSVCTKQCSVCRDLQASFKSS